MSSTAQDQSSTDLEEIFNLDPAVLEQLLQEEEAPQHNLVDVDSQTIDEAIQNLPPELREKIYNEFVSTKIRERKEMGWNEVHNDFKGAPFFACDYFCYTDDYISNFDLEEIYHLEADVLEQLLVIPFYEEEEEEQEPPQNIYLEAELEEIDIDELQELIVDCLLTNPEDRVKVEEACK